jgi:uncharacterized damage-inducible protein DinB
MEPWLRPDGEEAAELTDLTELHIADVHKSLEQALYWLREHIEATPEEALWWEPAPGVPSIGARLHHVIHASERLATYAFAEEPDYEALAAEARRDWTPPAMTKAELLAGLEKVFNGIQQQLQQLSSDAFYRRCFVGRRRIPVRRSTILHHIAEHAAYHAGQLIVVLRLWQAQHAASTNA